MATSGSINLLAPATDLITEAMEHCGILAEGESASTNQLTTGRRTLNYMIKGWQTRGTNLWCIQRLYVYLEDAKQTYSLGQGSGDEFTSENPQDNTTTLSAAAASGATSLSLTSGATSANSDRIGIELTDGTSHWTTISAGGGTNTVTIAVALPSAAASGNRVYWLTNLGNRPIKVLEALVVNETGDTETPIDVLPRRVYGELSNKEASGQINQVYYDPQHTTGVLHVWPTTDDVTDYLKLYVKRTVEDYDANTDDSDFPQEWYHAIAWNLALALCPKYGIDAVRFNQIKSIAEPALFDAESHDSEDWFQVVPEYRY